jgi:hypothetical protein
VFINLSILKFQNILRHVPLHVQKTLQEPLV